MYLEKTLTEKKLVSNALRVLFHPLSVMLIWFSIMGIIATLSMIPNLHLPDNSDKICHAIAYFVLTLWPVLSFKEGRGILLAVLPIFFLGVAIEIVQGSVAGRFTSVADLSANVVGIVCALICGYAWRGKNKLWPRKPAQQI